MSRSDIEIEFGTANSVVTGVAGSIEDKMAEFIRETGVKMPGQLRQIPRAQYG